MLCNALAEQQRKGRHKLDAELEVFVSHRRIIPTNRTDIQNLCTVPPGLGCTDRVALFIVRFWSRFTERLMPLPCRGKQASLGGARVLYAATGAISSVIINIVIFIFVCILAGAPAFMYGQIIWILITKPLLKYVMMDTHTELTDSWIPVLGAFLNFTGQPVTRAANRIETLLLLRSCFRHHDDTSQFKNEKNRLRWELDVAPEISINYGKTLLEKIAGKNARQVSKDAQGGGCCCCSCC